MLDRNGRIPEPQWYHISSRTGGLFKFTLDPVLMSRSGKLYAGDYHPDKQKSEVDHETHPEIYESEPRKCDNCGEVKWCLLKERVGGNRR